MKNFLPVHVTEEGVSLDRRCVLRISSQSFVHILLEQLYRRDDENPELFFYQTLHGETRYSHRIECGLKFELTFITSQNQKESENVSIHGGRQ